MTAVATPATLRLDGISVYAHHGFVPEERSLGQRFEFDVEVQLDDCIACRTDELSDALAYESIVAVIVEVATTFRFRLMEALAEAVCAELLTEFPTSRVRLVVSKTAPSLPHAVSRATVVLERRAPGVSSARVADRTPVA